MKHTWQAVFVMALGHVTLGVLSFSFALDGTSFVFEWHVIKKSNFLKVEKINSTKQALIFCHKLHMSLIKRQDILVTQDGMSFVFSAQWYVIVSFCWSPEFFSVLFFCTYWSLNFYFLVSRLVRKGGTNSTSIVEIDAIFKIPSQYNPVNPLQVGN